MLFLKENSTYILYFHKWFLFQTTYQYIYPNKGLKLTLNRINILINYKIYIKQDFNFYKKKLLFEYGKYFRANVPTPTQLKIFTQDIHDFISEKKVNWKKTQKGYLETEFWNYFFTNSCLLFWSFVYFNLVKIHFFVCPLRCEK